jgi:hypothetical protein
MTCSTDVSVGFRKEGLQTRRLLSQIKKSEHWKSIRSLTLIIARSNGLLRVCMEGSLFAGLNQKHPENELSNYFQARITYLARTNSARCVSLQMYKTPVAMGFLYTIFP